MRSLRRSRLALLTLVVLCSASLCGWWLSRANAQANGKKRQIPTTRASGSGSIIIGDCRVTLLKKVRLAFDRVGTIALLDLVEGDLVKQNHLVARLNDEVARAALASAQKKALNDVHRRYATKAHALAKVERQKAELTNKNTGMAVYPLIEIKRLILAEERSELQIEQAQSDQVIAGLDRDLANAQLRAHYLAAPFDGFVTRVYKQTGEAVRQGDTVIELINTEKLKVSGWVSLREIARLKPGMKVTVRLVDTEDAADEDPLEKLPQAFLDARFQGRLVYIDPGTSSGGSREVKIWAEVDNSKGLLRHGLTAEMSIDPSRAR